MWKESDYEAEAWWTGTIRSGDSVGVLVEEARAEMRCECWGVLGKEGSKRWILGLGWL